MKLKALIVSLFLAFSALTFIPSQAQKSRSKKAKSVHVKSYTTKSGKHVSGHYRSAPRHR